jgi:putative nucleotidyltransferase with HDIG domain
MDESPKVNWRQRLLISLFLMLIAVLALAAIVSPSLIAYSASAVNEGQVAEQDYIASQEKTYTSEVLTEQRRQQAVASVSDRYTLPDTSVVRQQVEKLREALAYIANVRADPYALQKQKLEDLAALEDIQLSRESAEILLTLNDIRWQPVEQEAISVLEQLMRQPIRPGDLENLRDTVPAMISLALSQNQAQIVSELVQSFLAPNSFFSPELTENARENAGDAVQPVIRTYVIGQTIVRQGEVIDAEDVEALQQLGLASRQIRWQDYAGALALVAAMSIFLLLYIQRAPAIIAEARSLVLVSILFIIFLTGARLSVFGHVITPYVYPVAGFGLLVAALFGTRVAMIATLPLTVMITFGMPNALDLTVYYLVGSLFGILALGRARRISAFIYSGFVVAVSGWLVILAYRLPAPTTDWLGLLSLSAASLFNGMASAALAIVMQHLLALLLGTSTPMQLMELTRPDRPLLQFILQQAPGTYQHSLQVSNLAEQAAEQIGADPLLTRVGALYHDCGKAVNPFYFIENQLPGFNNPHEDLEPEASAVIILNHVKDGLKLAKTYRLPRRISDFISEHHGTTLTRYQYVMAVSAVGGQEDLVDPANFRYPGPKPQSRETAILMLADASEARVRAQRPRDEAEMLNVIKDTIMSRVGEGQLDDADLTMRDLTRIAESFMTTLRGIYHPRVVYPQLEAAKSAAPPSLPASTQQETPDSPNSSEDTVPAIQRVKSDV